MNGKRIRIGWVLFLVLALMAAGCGGDDDDDTEASAGDETEEPAGDGTADEASGGEVDPADIETDFGVTDDAIRVGLLADLSGAFAGLVKDITLAQQVYWEGVNAAGGIAGRKIELVVEDNKYDVPTHVQLFKAMSAEDDNGVVMFAQSTGSPHTAAIKDDLVDKHLIAIPLSWYSAWADPEFGKNVFEAYTNYCFESINGMQYLFDNQAAKKVAVISFPGEYGQDGAKGAKMAAQELGMEVVFDGEAKVTPPTPTSPNPDNSGIVESIVNSGADLVWTTINPATLAVIMGQAAAQGFKGKWSGNSPSYAETLLKSDVGPILDTSYFQSTYTVALGTDVPGMAEMVDAIKKSRPDARASDAFVYGWTEAQITEAILRAAAESGDMTRQGVEEAAFQIPEVDFGGLAPPQSWRGDPNEYIVRESYMFKPKTALRKDGPIGVGNTGSELLEGPFSSPISGQYDFEANGACFKS